MRRLAAAVGLLSLLLALCVWWTGLIASGRIGHLGLLDRPHDHDGEPIVLSLVTVLELSPPDRFRVAEGTLELEVVGSVEGRTVGEELTVIGVWDGDSRHVVAERVAPAPGRAGKKALGIVGLLALAALLPVWFVPAPGGLAVRG